MRRIVFISLSVVFFLGACGGIVSTPTPVSIPTSTPEPTQTPEAVMTPELIFEITNGKDGLKDPYGVAINSEGRIYVTDAGNSRVLIFDAEGKLLSKWDAQGNIFVADY